MDATIDPALTNTINAKTETDQDTALAAAAAATSPTRSPAPNSLSPNKHSAYKIPIDSPLRTHPKRLLPSHLASTYPHGHLSGHPRTGDTLHSFEARRQEILRTMTAAQIEKRYEEVAAQVVDFLEEAERRGREVEGEKEKLRMEREMERRVWGKLRRLSGGK